MPAACDAGCSMSSNARCVSNNANSLTDNPPPYTDPSSSRATHAARTRPSPNLGVIPASPPLPSSPDVTPSSPPPSYRASGGPPPYFPRTPLERWTAPLHRPGWEIGDLSTFETSGHDTWEHEHAAVATEMREWELTVDPNAGIRQQMQDPAGWLAVTDADVQFVDASFPPEIRNTALTLRPAVEADFMYDHLGFNPDLEDAIHSTLALGTYRKKASYRYVRYFVPSPNRPGEYVPYDASWMLASLGPHLSVQLGQLLLTQANYSKLVKAMFIVQCRRKFLLDARQLISERKQSMYWRWRRGNYIAAEEASHGMVSPQQSALPAWFTSLNPLRILSGV